jgi:hypothetical protein
MNSTTFCVPPLLSFQDPLSTSLILEMVTDIQLNVGKLQHVTPLNPESGNYTLALAEKHEERKACFDVLLL